MIQIIIEDLRSAIQSIRSNKVRSFLTMLGVIIGVFSVVTLISLVQGLDKQIRDQFSNIGSELIFVVAGDIESSNPFSESSQFARLKHTDIAILQDVSNVKNVTPQYPLPVRIKNLDREQNGMMLGMASEFADVFGLKMESGEFYKLNNEEKVVIGFKVANNLYGSPNRALGKKIVAGGKTYLIKGVLKDNKSRQARFEFNDAIFVPPLTMERNHDVSLVEIIIKLKNPELLQESKRELTLALLKDHGEKDFSILTNEDLGDILGNITGFLSIVLGGITSISLLVGGIGIMNIMLVNVTERTKEIGIRKALGATNFSILTQFMIEAVIVSLIGGAIGLLLGYAAGYVIKIVADFQSNISFTTILLSLGFSTLVGVVFGIAPAYNASKRDPVEALRYE